MASVGSGFDRISGQGRGRLSDRMIAAGFDVPSLATQAYMSEAVKLGLLDSAETYDRFWREAAELLLRGAMEGPGSSYRSAYIEELISGQDIHSFGRLNPGLFDQATAFPGGGIDFHKRRLEIIRAQKAIEVANGVCDGHVSLLKKGPAAVFRSLAKSLPLEFRRGRELGLPIDGPCLVGDSSERLRPILFFEPGRRRARVDLSADILLLRDGQLFQGFRADTLVRGIGWYRHIASQDEEALGLAAYARFVVELAAALNDGEGTGETR